MKMNDVVKRAKKLGMKAKAVKKADLIRQIQRAEGNFDCFGTAVQYCDQWKCCFREDCLPPIKAKHK
jgi:predicted metal-binding transcription factor (methanogenesis marker protein 9)